jgi:hypothetical protein
VDLLPWQQEPKGDYEGWIITGGRGTGKSTAIHLALARRAVNGEACMLIVGSDPTYWTRRLGDLIEKELGLDPVEDFQVSLVASAIHFREGGLIRVMLPHQVAESGRSWKEATVAADQVDFPSLAGLYNLRGMQRVMRAVEGEGRDGIPVVEVTPRDAP